MDDELRGKTREAATGGSPEDRARVMRALLRAGRLSLGKIKIAAHLGDEAARIATGYITRKETTRQKLSVWLWGLKPGGKEAFCRAGLAMASRTRPPSLVGFGGPLLSVQEWLECPCKEHENDLADWMSDLNFPVPFASWMVPVIACCVRACLSYSLPQVRKSIRAAGSTAVNTLYETYRTGDTHEGAVAESEEDLKRAITADLLPWALADFKF